MYTGKIIAVWFMRLPAADATSHALIHSAALVLLIHPYVFIRTCHNVWAICKDRTLSRKSEINVEHNNLIGSCENIVATSNTIERVKVVQEEISEDGD